MWMIEILYAGTNKYTDMFLRLCVAGGMLYLASQAGYGAPLIFSMAVLILLQQVISWTGGFKVGKERGLTEGVRLGIIEGVAFMTEAMDKQFKEAVEKLEAEGAEVSDNRGADSSSES